MNFQNIPVVNKADEYIETAFSKSKKISVKKTLNKDEARVKEFTKYLTNGLKKIYVSFPNMDALSEFYYELINSVTNINNLRKALSKIKWASLKIKELKTEYIKNFNKKEFYGRASSVIKQINSHLKLIEKSRHKMKGLPDIKENIFTVCVVGFPNVGKSTLLSKITSSTPDIQSYAFTTKGLNTGYFSYKYQKIQIVDTPGTLARYNKMNSIEKQAYLAIKYIADLIVFVYDLSEEYLIEAQDNLLNIVKKYDKPIIFYLSKTDILSSSIVKSFKSNRSEEFIDNSEEIKKAISKLSRL